MYEIKVFDAKGDLLKVISKAEAIARNDELIKNPPSPYKARLTMKGYTCSKCRKGFESNSTNGATYCLKCRPEAYKLIKRRKRKEKKAGTYSPKTS